LRYDLYLMNIRLPLPTKDKTYNVVIEAVAALMIILFVYAAVSKLLRFSEFKEQMHLQALPYAVASVAVWMLPALEIFIALLLSFRQWRYTGFVMSGVLMFLFTGYIGMVLSGLLGKVPCSCGGVIQSLGWKAHLFFNLFFLLLSFLGIYLINRERRLVGKE
jgi:putative oxidoreductase